MGKYYIVDRLEENIAVLEDEDGGHVNALRSLVFGAHEGDVLEVMEDGFTVREDLTRERRERIREKQKKLFKHRSEET
ncbi:MAG: DUF3006 domain-containing protein [Oscillospiraceae bacterium]|nr:DUF3006 domain-containing protein [Oscillospiraceae bacterium]